MSATKRQDSQFDPYHRWLGIPLTEQPPTLYRLLGIVEYEDDADVITSAADRQMAHVKSFAMGPYARYSQTLLNELAKARLCLLNSTEKQRYDLALRQRRAAIVSAAASAKADRTQAAESRRAAEQPQRRAVAVAKTAAPKIRLAVRPRQRHRSTLATLAITLLGGVALIAGLLWYAKYAIPPPSETTTPQANAQLAPPLPAVPAPNLPGPAPREPEPAAKLNEVPLDPPLPGNRQPRGPVAPQVGPKDPVVVGDPFAELPESIDIKSTAVPMLPLGRVNAQLSDSRPLEVELIVPEFLDHPQRRMFLRATSLPSDGRRWEIFESSEEVRRQMMVDGVPPSVPPLASCELLAGEMTMHWSAAEEDAAAIDRLSNCLLHLVHEDADHSIALCRPLIDRDPIVVGNWKEKFIHVIPLEGDDSLGTSAAWPGMDHLRLRLHLQGPFPPIRADTQQPDRVAEGQVFRMIFTSDESAGVACLWDVAGKRLQVHVAPGFRLAAFPDRDYLLTPAGIELAQKALDREVRETTRNLRRGANERVALQNALRQAESIQYRTPIGGIDALLRARRTQAIAAANQAIAANEAAVRNLQQYSALLAKVSASELPPLVGLAEQLQGEASFGIELYYEAGEHEVSLYRKGVPVREHPSNPR